MPNFTGCLSDILQMSDKERVERIKEWGFNPDVNFMEFQQKAFRESAKLAKKKNQS